jgi:hypothetical protein
VFSFCSSVNAFNSSSVLTLLSASYLSLIAFNSASSFSSNCFLDSEPSISTARTSLYLSLIACNSFASAVFCALAKSSKSCFFFSAFSFSISAFLSAVSFVPSMSFLFASLFILFIVNLCPAEAFSRRS